MDMNNKIPFDVALQHASHDYGGQDFCLEMWLQYCHNILLFDHVLKNVAHVGDW